MKTGINKKCLLCQKEFYARRCEKDRKKYCSYRCSQTVWLERVKKGKPTSEETRLKLRKIALKRRHIEGTEYSYASIHGWLSRHYSKIACERGDKCRKGWRLEWALKKGKKHSQNRNNYKVLCNRCHAVYDKNWLKRTRDKNGMFSK